MARLKILTNEELTSEHLAMVLKKEENGSRNNLSRILGNNERVAVTMLNLFDKIMHNNSLTMDLVELVIVFIAKTKECEYCLSIHIQKALDYGVTEDQVLHVLDFETHTEIYAPKTLALLRFVKKILTASQNVKDEDMDSVKEFFCDSEIMDIIALVCAVFSTTSFNNTLAIDLSESQLLSLREIEHLL